MTMNILSERKWIEQTWEKVDKKLSKVAVRSFGKLPYTTGDGAHDEIGKGAIDWWTNGFWGGMMWLMYAETKKDVYKDTAINSEKLLNKALKNFKCLHHDVGFMWHLTSGAHARLLGNEASYNTNLYIASTLASRYNADGGFITAWNGEGEEGWTIIDCLMNIPMLYWASNETKHDRFRRIAMKHADMAIRDHIRPDGSVNHIVEHNLDTGDVTNIYAGQGYAADSCWTRGASWAIYGMIISYRHTQKREYLDAVVRCADYYVRRIKEFGYKNPVDFDQPKEPVYYDSTGGLCAVCGLLEISKYIDDIRAEEYIDTALKILKATDENFCDYDEDTDALVLYGTERYPHENMNGVHIPIIYGDFFFVEALLKLKGNNFFIW